MPWRSPNFDFRWSRRALAAAITLVLFYSTLQYTAVHTGMIEPGKYSFYVGKRPQIAHGQLQQYCLTAAIAFMRFAVFCRHKNCINYDPPTRLHTSIFFKFSDFIQLFSIFQYVVAVPGSRVWRIIVNTGLPVPIAYAARSNKRPPICMVRSWKIAIFQDPTVLLVFPIEAGISWSAPELLYLRVLKNISKVTNSRLI
jgi:hypothetical protein